MRFALLKSKYLAWILVTLGLLCISVSIEFHSKQPERPRIRGSLERFPVPAALSFGHREFAWSLWAMQGLSSIVNAWQAGENPNIANETKQQLDAKLKSFITELPEFSKESLGMREIFLFPASYFAFVRGDTNTALQVANLGLNDPRLAPDLSLMSAYIMHLSSDDLNAIAQAYEKVLKAFPSVTWLNQTITLLRSGVDPFLVKQDRKMKSCEYLTKVFPFSGKQLVKKKICPPDFHSKELSQ